MSGPTHALKLNELLEVDPFIFESPAYEALTE
jgi:hypothetical protein